MKNERKIDSLDKKKEGDEKFGRRRKWSTVDIAIQKRMCLMGVKKGMVGRGQEAFKHIDR